MLTKRLRNLTPYVAGEQPLDKKYIKLNTNENPYPPSPAVKELLGRYDADHLRLYPDPLFTRLRKTIAARFSVKPEQVFAGNGSDEILSFAFFAFFDSADGPLLFPEFTYSFYPVYCDFYGIEYGRIPLAEDFSIDSESYPGPGKSCGIVFPNPNAPTGMFLPLVKIRELLERYPGDRVVVIDEAYIDFGGESAVPLINQYGNLLIVQTCSKSYSLAGLRLGYALGNEELIKALFAVKDSFNSYTVDTLAQKIAEAAIADEDYYGKVNQMVVRTREYFTGELQKIGFDVLPSMANFVLARKKGIEGRTIYSRLKEEGILVRHFDKPGLKDFVRITIGLPGDMEILLQKLREKVVP
ncbi:MAG: histidinol-phosphate transaminase [Spirochaetales bacterium]|nr:histidinol-phosphate transaminase [Spirochaetales bacterium]